MRRRMVWVVCLGLAAAGCGGGGNQPVTQDAFQESSLSDVGELYRVYMAEHKKPPEKIADLQPIAMLSPRGLSALQSGEVIVYWKGNMTDLQEGPPKGNTDVVLAYEKKVPTEGGQVLLLDRSIKTMTPEQFKAAPKAGTTDSSGGLAKAK